MSHISQEELKKAFAELHEKVIDTRHKLRIFDLQIDTLNRTKQRCELTSIEIRGLCASNNMFQTVGRMFLLQDKDTIRTDLKKRIKMAEEKIKILENNKSYLQQSLKECENNIREMIQKK